MAYGQMIVHRACFCIVIPEYEVFESEQSERTGEMRQDRQLRGQSARLQSDSPDVIPDGIDNLLGHLRSEICCLRHKVAHFLG